jgi:hypothetical protein
MRPYCRVLPDMVAESVAVTEIFDLLAIYFLMACRPPLDRSIVDLGRLALAEKF